MTVYSALTAVPMHSQDGVVAGNANWRLVVRIAIPPANAGLLGTFILGTDVLADITWRDISADMYGMTYQRGSTTAGSRVGAGQLNFRLNNNAGTYAPTASNYYGPGTLVQVGFYDPSTTFTYYLFTGFTLSWNESQDNAGAHRWIDVEALETLALLVEVDNAAISAVGSGETIGFRIIRLMAAANWQFSYSSSIPVPVNTWTMQATTLGQDMWTELCRTVDSTSLVAIPLVNGDILVTYRTGMPNAAYGSTTYRVLGVDVPIVADSIVTANDDETLLAQVSVSRTGGTAVNYENSGINGRYQYRSTQRTDLITNDPGSNADLARYASDILGRAAQTYRIRSLQLDSLNGHEVFEFLSDLELYTPVDVWRPDPTGGSGTYFANYLVCGYKVDIEPMNQFAGVHIKITIETEPTSTTTSSAATDSTFWDIATWDDYRWS